MEFLKLLLQFTAITSILLLVLGLYKPWVVLWWEDIQNRKKVVMLYGSVAIILWILHLLV